MLMSSESAPTKLHRPQMQAQSSTQMEDQEEM